MKMIIDLLSDKRGNSIPLAITIALVIVIISCGIFEYFRLMIIASGVRDAVQASIISVSTGNYDEVYNCLREGYSGGYELDGERWQEVIEIGDVYDYLDKSLGLRNEGGYHVKYAGDKVEFRVSGFSVNVINAAFAPNDRDKANEFLAEATIFLEVPLSFGWERLPPMGVDLKLKAGYTPKF